MSTARAARDAGEGVPPILGLFVVITILSESGKRSFMPTKRYMISK